MLIESCLAFPIGIFISSIVSSVGIGGGILWMPFFLLFMNIKPESAVVTSLLIQTAGMGSGSISFLRQNRVDKKLAIFLFLITVPGVIAGACITNKIDTSSIELILGIFTLAIAFLFVSANDRYSEQGKSRVDIRTAYRYSWVTVLMSIGSGLLSISLGEWLIPIMRSKLSLRMRNAVATSVSVIFGTCITGSIIHLIIGGRPETTTLLWAIPGVMIGGQIGPRISERINDRLLKEIFVFILTLAGVHLIYNSY